MAASIDELPQGENPEKLNIAEHFVDAPATLLPHRPAIVGEPREVSYGELAALTNRAGNALRAQGVSRGDRVLIALPDSVEFVAAFFGAVKIGAVAVPVNPFARSSDYIHYLENSEPSVAIVHSESLAEFLPASSVRPQIPIIVAGENKIDLHGVSCAKWSAWIAAAGEKLIAADTSPQDPAFMLYTSGSGGAPKAAVHPCRHAHHQPELCPKHSRPSRRRFNIFCLQIVFRIRPGKWNVFPSFSKRAHAAESTAHQRGARA